MQRFFKVNAPSVVSEIIDGEAVFVNLISGHYFSTGPVGSQLWEWLGQGASDEAMAQALTARYHVEGPSAATALDAFLADLLAHELVLEHPEARPTPPFEPPAAAPATRMEWSPPTLDVYSDMTDLLLLDPIHDVDEAGWPMPKPPNTSIA